MGKSKETFMEMRDTWEPKISYHGKWNENTPKKTCFVVKGMGRDCDGNENKSRYYFKSMVNAFICMVSLSLSGDGEGYYVAEVSTTKKWCSDDVWNEEEMDDDVSEILKSILKIKK